MNIITTIIILIIIVIIIIAFYFIFFKKSPKPLKETKEVLITGAQGTQNVFPSILTIPLLLVPNPFSRKLPILWPHSIVPLNANTVFGEPYSILKETIPKGWKDYMIPMIHLQADDEVVAGPYFLMPPKTSLEILQVEGEGEQGTGSKSSPKFREAYIIVKITIKNFYYYLLWSHRDNRDTLYEKKLLNNEIVTLFCGPPISDFNTSAAAGSTVITMKVENCTSFYRESFKYVNDYNKTTWEGQTSLVFDDSNAPLGDFPKDGEEDGVDTVLQ